MLKIKGNETYYVLEDKHVKPNDDKVKMPPPPKVPNPNKIPFHRWCSNYEHEIKTIVDELTDNILQLKSDNYVCHVDINTIKKEFVRKMYDTSYSSNKYFI